MREGRVKSPSGAVMPDIYRENVMLQDRVVQLLEVVEKFRDEARQGSSRAQQSLSVLV